MDMAFTSCRLCLEKRGHYKIIPHTRMQIKSCFDINVKPFDGLPHFICKDCQIWLSENAEMKRKIKKKQKSLLSKLSNQQQDNHSSAQQPDRHSNSLPNVETNTRVLVCNSQTSSTDRDSCKGDTNQQQDNHSSAQQPDRHANSLPNVETNTRVLVCNSQTSSTDRDSCKGDTNQQQDNHSSAQQPDRHANSLPNVETNTRVLVCNSQTSSTDRDSCKGDTNQQQDIVTTAHQANNIKKNVVKRPRSLWKKDYIKHYVCRFCSKSCKQERSISTHLKQCKLKVKYSNGVQNCYVKLNRMGSRPNLTSSNENVVYRKDNIIHFINKNYYVMYTFKDKDFKTTKKGKKHLLNSTGPNETRFLSRSSSSLIFSLDSREKMREDEVIYISDSDCDDSEFITVYQIIN